MSSVLFWHNLDPQPMAFHIGNWPIHWYGLILAAAFLVGFLFAARRARKFAWLEKDFLKMFWAVFLSGAVGARVWDFFVYQSAQPLQNIFYVWQGGLAIHGFLLGGFLGLILFRHCEAWRSNLLQSHQVGIATSFAAPRNDAKKFRIYNLKFIILLAPSFLLAQAVGRWGNFFNQELYGAPTTLPWGIFIATANRLPGFENFQYFQPVFLYESLWLFLGLGIFLWLERKLSSITYNLKPKTLLSFFISWLFAGRALMELIRLDPTPLWFGLRAPLVYSAIIAIISLVYLIVIAPVRRSFDEGGREQSDRGDLKTQGL